ncbi:PilZ domain-containing protein [Magnetococcus sp. PR-3]|uniref:PilZ domain-containing protein n=1 Tax=Magnetococcus sp. PR-3 TaxID=3120355 RepID=UPI002FCDFC49
MAVKKKYGSDALKPSDFQIKISPIKKATPYKQAIQTGQRKHLRISHDVNAEVRFKSGIRLNGTTRDISATGLFVQLPTPPAHIDPGTQGCILMYPKHGKVLKFGCEVVRTMERGIALLLTDHDRHEMGITLLYDILETLENQQPATV